MNPSGRLFGSLLTVRVMQWLRIRPWRPQLAVQEGEVAGQLGLADVLGEPDRADRVEAVLGDVPVVHVPDLGQAGQARFLDGPLGPAGLLGRQGDAEGADPVLPRGVHHHTSPAAADVEQPHPRLQRQLPRDQVELVRLRLLQGRVRGRVARAGVGHGGAEHPLVERVGHVVVMRDRGRVAATRVPPAGQPAPADPDLLRRWRDPGQQDPWPAQPAQQGQPLGQAEVRPLGRDHPGQRGVHVAVDVQVPGHVGARQPHAAGRLGQVGHRDRRTDRDRDRRVSGPRAAAVVGPEPDGRVRARYLLENLRQCHCPCPFVTACRRTSRTARRAGPPGRSWPSAPCKPGRCNGPRNHPRCRRMSSTGPCARSAR